LELFKKPKKIENIITETIIVPETSLANELLIKFISQHKSLAIVVDEFGGTSGIVTMEDIMEEIFGEINDEHDDKDATYKKIDDYTYQLSARTEIEKINKDLNWNLPYGDYETLGGYILELSHNLPNVDDVIVDEHFEFHIKSKLGARIDQVKVIIKKHIEF
jgi:CBS domain containing-hemolysin-like protein